MTGNLTNREVCKFLHIGKNTLCKIQNEGKLPFWTINGKDRRTPYEALTAFVKANLITEPKHKEN